MEAALPFLGLQPGVGGPCHRVATKEVCGEGLCKGRPVLKMDTGTKFRRCTLSSTSSSWGVDSITLQLQRGWRAPVPVLLPMAKDIATKECCPPSASGYSQCLPFVTRSLGDTLGGWPSTGGGLPQLHLYIWTESPCASADPSSIPESHSFGDEGRGLCFGNSSVKKDAS